MRYTLMMAGLLALLMAPVAAHASPAVVASHTGLRAGPGKAYPLLFKLERGMPVDVLGCVAGWHWCEVVAPGGLHGWAVGHRIGYYMGGRNVQLDLFGPRIGLPIVVFEEQAYWARYYPNRDFYISRYGHGHPVPMVVEEHHDVVVDHHHHEGDSPEDHMHHTDYDGYYHHY